MCGICGKVYFDPQREVDKQLIQRMCQSIRHRGPDDWGVFVHRHVGLGHRRLSIIDVETGQQPMSNARKDIWIVYNGEIYNFQELRQDLEKWGYTFLTNSDTEVILHLYDHYGVNSVNMLRGMFAFAIWDQRVQRLFLARDRIGQKPLFYIHHHAFFAFASEIKSLLHDHAVTRELNLKALSDYLTYQYVPPPETMFRNIYKLPPAHALVCEHGHVDIQRYWDICYHPKILLNTHDMLSQIQNHLKESVRMRMVSDVPIGAFLSGGIDSSLIVAMMSQYSPQPVKTFSIGFQEKAFNELPYARLVAEHFHTEHHEFVVQPDAVEILPKLIWHFDEPFGDVSAIPTYYLAKMTSRHVKVVLNGDGGDESFAGYLRYLGYKLLCWYCILPYSLRKHAFSPFIDQLSASANIAWMPERIRTLFKRLKLLHDFSLEPEQDHYVNTIIIFMNLSKQRILSCDVRNQLKNVNSLEYMRHYFEATDHAEHFVDQMLYADVMTYLPGDLLVKIDKMTMAHGVESRSPFLDHPLMEFAARIPARAKFPGWRLKSLLKQLGKTMLPQEILSRPKQGFAVPIGQWIRNDLREMVFDTCESSLLVKEDILDRTGVQQILHEHQDGKTNHQYKIWLLLNLELWYRMFIKNQ